MRRFHVLRKDGGVPTRMLIFQVNVVRVLGVEYHVITQAVSVFDESGCCEVVICEDWFCEYK